MIRLALFLALCSCAWAEKLAVRWVELGPVIASKQLTIDLKDGTRVRGVKAETTTDSLLLERKDGKRQTIPRKEIREIRVSRKARQKWRWIGAAAGAGIGLGVSAPVLAETHNEGSTNYDGVAAGLIAGLAAVGYLVGLSSDRAGDVVRILPD